MTALIGSNDDAVAFLSERPLAGLDVSLIARALQCRKTAADPDALFPARTVLPSQIDACATLLTGQSTSLRQRAERQLAKDSQARTIRPRRRHVSSTSMARTRC
jgi:hypothetical protein